MADDLSIQLVIKALLDSKGFEEAKVALKGLADKANESAPALGKTGDAAKGLTKELGGTRGGVADLTRVLLNNIGVTGPAGQVAKAAGTAISFMGSAATLSAVAVTGGVAAIALILPKIVEWISRSREAAAAQKEIEQSVLNQLPRLEDLALQIGAVNVALNEQIRALRSQAIRAQQAEIDKNVASIKEMEQRISDNTEKAERWTKTIEEFTARTGKAPGGLQAELAGLNDAIARETDEVDRVSAATVRLMDAQEAGVTLQRAETDAVTQGTEARRKAKEALERQKKAQEDMNQALRDGLLYIDQGALARDSERVAAADQQRALGKLTKAQVDTLTKMPKAEVEAEGDKQRQVDAIRRADLETERRTSLQKMALIGEVTSAGISALGSFFGHNKTVRIAQAIADTFAAATRALAELGPIAGPVMAAVITAQGLANVKAIRETNIGFDDPFSDLLAEKLGRRSAADFVEHFGAGFRGGMRGGGVVNNYNSRTTINRGTTNTIGKISGVIGSRTEFAKWFERMQTRAERSRRRTSI